jgi:acid phosphatase (class A)
MSVVSILPYDRNLWDANYRGLLHLAEFGRSEWWRHIDITQVGEPYRNADPKREIDDLLRLATTERFAHLPDILAQDRPPWVYWFKPLSLHRGTLVNERTFPRTFDLMYATAHTAAIVFHYKDHFKRARPSVVDTRLTTALAVPGHPAYPSGHSTQSHLISMWLARLVPGVEAEMSAVAEDITINRERAGLHYASDSQAGRILAQLAFPLMEEHSRFRQTFEEARREWI